LKIIGLIEEYEEFGTLTTLYKIFKKFYNIKVVTSYKKILKNTGFTTLDKYLLHLAENSTDLLLIKLKPSEIFHKELKNMKFNILLLSDAKQFLNIGSIQTDNLVYNYDNYINNSFIREHRSNKYSFGLSYNADFFPSSIGLDFSNNQIMLCINKNISTLSGKNVESQEFLVKLNISVESKIYNILAAFICSLLLDIDLTSLIPQVELFLKEEKINV